MNPIADIVMSAKRLGLKEFHAIVQRLTGFSYFLSREKKLLAWKGESV